MKRFDRLGSIEILRRLTANKNQTSLSITADLGTICNFAICTPVFELVTKSRNANAFLTETLGFTIPAISNSRKGHGKATQIPEINDVVSEHTVCLS